MRLLPRLFTLSLLAFLSGCPAASLEDPRDGRKQGGGGTSSGATNGAPRIAGVSLGAGPYYVSTTLTAAPVNPSDPDGDTVTLTYQWFVNDQALSGAHAATLAGAFAPGDRVFVTVTPFDGTLAGGAVTSAAVSIENRPPTAPFVALYPAVLAEGLAQTLWTRIVTAATDPDGTALTYTYRWYRDGVAQSYPAGQTAVTVALVAGQTWRVEVVASDGQAAAAAATVSRSVPFVAAAIDAGGFACAVTTRGAAVCWGQYTDATYTQLQRTPIVVAGLESGVAAVAVGNTHACALTTGGGVKCWGRNDYGQIGQGVASAGLLPPLDVPGLTSGVTAVASGAHHACALTTGGGVKCWGYNYHGQLGNGGTADQASPVNVTGLASGVRAISAGGYQTCALTAGGGVKCWGTGGGTTPADVAGLTSGVAEVSAGGDHTCVRTTGGAAKCWGSAYRMLGNGTINTSGTPVDVVGLSSGATQLDTGFGGLGHTCALVGGEIRCWGSNYYAQIGDGSGRYWAPTPATVPAAGKTWAALAAGGSFTCALTTAGAVYCWGDLSKVGTGQLEYTTRPVAGARGVKKLSLAATYSCALKTDDTAACWGRNMDSDDVTLAPAPITSVAGPLSDVAAGENHLCVLTPAGVVKCLGNSSDGQLGDGNWASSSPQPAQPINLLPVTALVSGSMYSCALEIGGSVKCWGKATVLAGGTTWQDNFTPRQLTGLGSVAQLQGGREFAAICGIQTNKTAKCYYAPTDGQYAILDLPFAGVLDAARAWAHGCAVSSAGGVKCWGDNNMGALGNGTIDPTSGYFSTTFYDVVGLTSGVKAVAVANHHSCALTTAGGVKCWGYNAYGQLGDGTTTNRTTPVDVAGITGATALYAYDTRTCALFPNGDTQCWGAGYFGAETPETAGWVPYRPVSGFVP
jgi:alpha-tubulin suppressor-like RCC1 family protein